MDVADLSARQPGARTATLRGIEHRTRSTITSGSEHRANWTMHSMLCTLLADL